jgi:hypothetical protein
MLVEITFLASVKHATVVLGAIGHTRRRHRVLQTVLIAPTLNNRMVAGAFTLTNTIEDLLILTHSCAGLDEQNACLMVTNVI